MRKTIQIRDVEIGSGIPKICVPITGQTGDEISRQASRIASKMPDLVEWRGDYYEDIEDHERVADILDEIVDILGQIPLLFTFRTPKEGGERQITPEDYVNLNKMVSQTGLIDLLDVEIGMGDGVLAVLSEEAHQQGQKVIVSNHHFRETPSLAEMLTILQRMDGSDADILKLAVMPKDEGDVLTLLTATARMKVMTKKPLITMSMGKLGVPSRICGECFGSAVTFASAGRASAPGQIDITDLQAILTRLHKSLQP